ncbi:MAG: 4-hydroxy-tetrahydrodipicolinate reductase, partial [Puniceicoccales bacterium]|nr:4-hydroxy-tetrahydrodipicolinate reductase [Puniceicoccales bacterium]
MKFLLQGATGRMGTVIRKLANERRLDVVPMVRNANIAHYPAVDVLIDFSSKEGFMDAISIALSMEIPLISGTTAIGEDGQRRMAIAAKQIPILWSSNFSVAFAVLRRCVSMAADALGPTFDVEIVECHHREKRDVPSGSTHLLLNSIASQENANAVYGRHGPEQFRGNEIGIHSLRGGGIGGRHEVLFLGKSEKLSFSHESYDRNSYGKVA